MIGVLQQHWALVAGSAIGSFVVLFVVFRSWQDSTHGRLRGNMAQLAQKRRMAARQERIVARAETHLARAQARADELSPLRLEKAREAVTDGRALLRIFRDQVMIVETRLRTIITEEIPPRRQDAMREKFGLK